jgi:hypothetical protein
MPLPSGLKTRRDQTLSALDLLPSQPTDGLCHTGLSPERSHGAHEHFVAKEFRPPPHHIYGTVSSGIPHDAPGFRLRHRTFCRVGEGRESLRQLGHVGRGTGTQCLEEGHHLVPDPVAQVHLRLVRGIFPPFHATGGGIALDFCMGFLKPWAEMAPIGAQFPHSGQRERVRSAKQVEENGFGLVVCVVGGDVGG